MYLRTRLSARQAAALCALLLLVLFCALCPIFDIDEWWHIATGRWILEHGSLPQHDIFTTVSPPGDWRSFEWLWQVSAAIIDRYLGLEALRILNALWITGCIALLYLLLRREGETHGAALLLCAVMLLAFHDRIRVRPHVFGLGAWTVLALHVHRLRSARPAHLGAAAGFFLLWAAVHTGDAWLALCALLATGTVLLAGKWRFGARGEDRQTLLVVFSALIGWLLCPGSIYTLSYIAEQHGGTMAAIDEWSSWWGYARHPPNLNVLCALALTPIAAAMFVRALVRYRRILRAMTPGGNATPAGDAAPAGDAPGPAGGAGDADAVLARPYELAFAAVCVLLAIAFYRYTFLSVLAMIVLRGFMRSLPGAKRAAEAPRLRLAAPVLVGLISLLSLYYTAYYPYGNLAAGLRAHAQTFESRLFPVLLTQLLAESGIEARVGVMANWGGFVLYHGFPRLRVTCDGRMVALAKLIATLNRIVGVLESGSAEERRLLPALYSSLPADVLLMPHPAFPGGGDTGEWQRVVEAPQADLYLRRGPRLREWMQQLAAAHQRLRTASLTRMP